MSTGEEIAPRETYGRTLAALGHENKDIVVLDADLFPSTMTKYFKAEHPERFFEVGIAEANMMGIAAGLAAAGKIPFASTFAVFATGRCFDQIRVSIAQAKLNVKIVATHAGITVGEDGMSHQAIEDLALMCSLPGFTVIVPADSIETEQAIRAVAGMYGPCYIRLGRAKVPVINKRGYRFKIGKAVTMRKGNDMTIIGTGIMVAQALEAAKELAVGGIDCRVINMSTLKPVDEAAIVQAAEQTGAIVTAEEHIKPGGLGSTVAGIVVQNHPVPMEIVALNRYAESGSPDELMKKYGLTAREIVAAAKIAIKRKT
jgi:transketolase